MAMWMVHNRLLKIRGWRIRCNLKLVLIVLLVGGLVTSLSPLLTHAQEAPASALQASA